MFLLELFFGLFLLFLGGELIVRSAEEISAKFKMSKLLAGLTIIAFATSAPEIFVTIISASQDLDEIAIGGIVGSNISNALLVLGLTAIIFPVVIIDKKHVIKNASFLLFISLIFFLFAKYDNRLEIIFGLTLISCYVIFKLSLFLFRNKDKKQEIIKAKYSIFVTLLLTVISIFSLKYGSEFFISGATILAQKFGISQAVIGLTVVALGTSAPEIAASVIAALKKHSDFVIGNIIGSNLINIIFGLSLPAIAYSLSVNPNLVNIDIIFMQIIQLLLFFIFIFATKINRLIGGSLFLIYVCYIIYLF